MKRLVDETTDELARSLLQAGIEHHPPPVPVDDDAGPALFSEPAGKLD